ncbi:MAG: BlaI/MecI/CopY family transcriptional regulator [Nitrospinota bacterium]|nr:BlaI/MecI/CopY family transcriptional regulator [Nitrospinota bacterium]
MDLINTKEIERLIEKHKNEISKLEQLLSLSSSFDGSNRKRSATTAKPVRAKKGKKTKRAKRGSVTNSILDTLGAASKPMAAGDIRTILVDKGVVEKGSTTVYAMLSQMSKKGTVKKAKSANGIVYTATPSKK